eukprot:9504089-Pyramimonas_sp.AAC.2
MGSRITAIGLTHQAPYVSRARELGRAQQKGASQSPAHRPWSGLAPQPLFCRPSPHTRYTSSPAPVGISRSTPLRCTSSTDSGGQHPSSRLRVVSWNIQAWRDSSHTDNLERVAACLAELKPDVVCLNEVRWGSHFCDVKSISCEGREPLGNVRLER